MNRKRFFYLFSFLLLALIACDNQGSIKSNQDVVDSLSLKAVEHFIQPPIETLKIPFDKLLVPAEKGATFTFPSGANLEIPTQAFLDENGQIIKGEVEIYLREFANPLDFFLAGIPMQFDSAGTIFTFESAGMFEINAEQEGKAVFVNPESKPILSLKTQNIKAGNSIYYLT